MVLFTVMYLFRLLISSGLLRHWFYFLFLSFSLLFPFLLDVAFILILGESTIFLLLKFFSCQPKNECQSSQITSTNMLMQSKLKKNRNTQTQAHSPTHPHTHTRIYIYICMYVFIGASFLCRSLFALYIIIVLSW